MSLEKAIIHKKEKRKPYRGSKAFDCSCRNHGSCSYCENNRKIFDTKARLKLDGQEDEWFGYWNYADPADASSDHYEKLANEKGMSLWDID